MNAPEERNAERAAENPEAAAVDAVDAAVAASSSYELLKKDRKSTRLNSSHW